MSDPEGHKGWRKSILSVTEYIRKGLDRIISKDTKEAMAGIILYDDSPTGRQFDKLIVFIILLSVCLVVIETIPDIPVEWYWVMYVAEWVITILFTIEYILRIYLSRRPLRYIFSFYGLVDVLAILPTYLSFFFLGAQHFLVIRVLRLLRIFRIFKLGHFVSEGGIVVDALKASRIKIYVFLSFIGIISILIGTLMYMLEHQENAHFSSIASGIYWAIVTITTVGYGDIVPHTIMGRFLATFVMILGYGVLAVPTGIVTAEISNRVLKANRRDTRSCRFCGEHKHYYKARHCHNCGAVFSTEEEIANDESE